MIAGGVETAARADRLRELDCDYGQGYLFSKPVSADGMSALLAGWSAEQVATAG